MRNPNVGLDDLDSALGEAVARFDADALHARFEDDGRFMVLEGFLPQAVLMMLLRDVQRTRGDINRNYVPLRKKGGSVSRFALDRIKPMTAAIYRSGVMRRFIETLVGECVEECPIDDPHAYALYHYSKSGDHVGWHYDTSFYRGRRYTILLGLVSNTSSVFEYELHTRNGERDNEPGACWLAAGSLVIFDGDRLRHRVTPLRDHDGERVILTMEVVTDSTMTWWWRLISKVKDSVGYFGFRDTFLTRQPARQD